MSALDQALIKAFTAQHEQIAQQNRAAAHSRFVGDEMHDVAGAFSVDTHVVEASRATSPGQPPSAAAVPGKTHSPLPQYRTHAATPAMPSKPHIDVQLAAQKRSSAAGSASPPAAAAKKYPPHVDVVYPEQTQQDAPQQPEEEPGCPGAHLPADPYRPCWEVDGVDWPAVCDGLPDPMAGQLAAVAETVLQQAQQGRRMVVMTSARRGEGRTTLALLLARHVIDAGGRVALVDGDFENPALARRLGLAIDTGWEEMLAGRAAPGEVIVRAGGDSCLIVPLHAAVPADEVDDSLDIAALMLAHLAQQTDVVIVDSSPLTATEHPAAPGGHRVRVGTAIIVRDVRATSAEEIQGLAGHLDNSGYEVLGVAENFCNAEEESLRGAA